MLKYLPKINGPEDIRDLTREELSELCAELRSHIISTITEVGGHLAPTLGVIELTVALHYVYNCLLYTSPSPRDRTRSRMPSSA